MKRSLLLIPLLLLAGCSAVSEPPAPTPTPEVVKSYPETISPEAKYILEEWEKIGMALESEKDWEAEATVFNAEGTVVSASTFKGGKDENNHCKEPESDNPNAWEVLNPTPVGEPTFLLSGLLHPKSNTCNLVTQLGKVLDPESLAMEPEGIITAMWDADKALSIWTDDEDSRSITGPMSLKQGQSQMKITLNEDPEEESVVLIMRDIQSPERPIYQVEWKTS